MIELRDDGLKVERQRFARIYVEVNLQKRLLSKFRVGKRRFSVEYKGLGLICFECERYGHRKDDCLLREEKEKTKPMEEDSQANTKGKVDVATGESVGEKKSGGR